ncbi:AlbA family DNA-binding domain-containing protein [Corynebacterium hindlerae]|uniref:AlbA family DNA-binding domain-containing protein n=1 Tax=Corynebacterium hindlerae TaxID=699041 RepID=UPI0031B695F6
MIDAAIEQQIEETRDLDYKAKAPSAKAIKESDIPKDITAMANSGGGVIIFGVTDDHGKPGQRCEIGAEVNERWGQALNQAAMSKIQPPLFGVQYEVIPGEDSQPAALLIVVPDSNRTPHMVDRREEGSVGVPVRVGGDTHWLSESEIARMYRDRFSAMERSQETLQKLYERTSELRGNEKPWFVGVAIPKSEPIREAVDEDSASTVLRAARDWTTTLHLHAQRGGHNVYLVTNHSGRRGLRCWNYRTPTREDGEFEFVSLHDNGTVQTLCSILPMPETYEGKYWLGQIEIEIANLVSAARAQAEVTGSREFDFLIGVEWRVEEPQSLVNELNHLRFSEDPIFLSRFEPLMFTLNVLAPDSEILDAVYDVVEDSINQFGIQRPTRLNERVQESEES